MAILDKLANIVTTEDMQEMNYLADVELIGPATIAKDLLEENNYYEDKVVEEEGA